MSQHTMNKEKWITLFKAIGLSEDQMMKWHFEFESHYPQEHEAFLKWLQIPSQEIQDIRKQSQTP